MISIHSWVITLGSLWPPCFVFVTMNLPNPPTPTTIKKLEVGHRLTRKRLIKGRREPVRGPVSRAWFAVVGVCADGSPFSDYRLMPRNSANSEQLLKFQMVVEPVGMETHSSFTVCLWAV